MRTETLVDVERFDPKWGLRIPSERGVPAFDHGNQNAKNNFSNLFLLPDRDTETLERKLSKMLGVYHARALQLPYSHGTCMQAAEPAAANTNAGEEIRGNYLQAPIADMGEDRLGITCNNRLLT
jgi:hypothetical protein